jgi:two-component system alkaline phosphatase synthesis response regulator PhoP
MGKKILVVEDETELVAALKVRLETQDYEVVTAFDGEDGLRKAREEEPDLIILDVMLPKMDGFKVARLLKFDERYKSIPIIMLTAKSEQEDKALGEETGADEYITKPFEWEYLSRKIKEHLGEG